MHRSGKSATCNPISEPDLANALIDTITDSSKKDTVWNLGGPDEGMSMAQQGKLVADVLGKEEAKLLGVPIGIFDVIINGLQVLLSSLTCAHSTCVHATKRASLLGGFGALMGTCSGFPRPLSVCVGRPHAHRVLQICSSRRSWRMLRSLGGSVATTRSKIC